MDRGESRGGLARDVDRRTGIKLSGISDDLFEGLTVLTFVNRVDNPIGRRTEIDNVEDGGRNDLGGGLGFVKKSADDLVIDRECSRDDAQRHRPVHKHMPAAIAAGNFAAANKRANLVLFRQILSFEFSCHLFVEHLCARGGCKAKCGLDIRYLVRTVNHVDESTTGSRSSL